MIIETIKTKHGPLHIGRSAFGRAVFVCGTYKAAFDAVQTLNHAGLGNGILAHVIRCAALADSTVAQGRRIRID